MITETIHVDSIGHRIYPLFGGFQDRDFLVDQYQTHGGGGVMKTILNTNLAQNNEYRIRIKPPTGKKFHVTIPDGQGYVILLLNLGRICIHSHDGTVEHKDIPPVSEIFSWFDKGPKTSQIETARVSYVNLQCDGRKPSYAAPQVGYFKRAIGIYLKAVSIFFSSATFEEIIITGKYAPPWYPPDAFFDYYPAAFKFAGLAGGFLIPDPYVCFYYNKWTNPPIIDPGRFIHIV